MAARRLRCPRRSLRETRRRRRGPPPLRSAPGRAGGPGERARAEEAEAGMGGREGGKEGEGGGGGPAPHMKPAGAARERGWPELARVGAERRRPHAPPPAPASASRPRRTRPGRPVRRVCAPLPRRRPTPPSGQSARGGRGVEPAAPAQDPRARTPGFQDSTSGFFKNFQRFIYKLLHAHLRTNTICIQNRTVCKLNGVILENLLAEIQVVTLPQLAANQLRLTSHE
ncbi:uncharacterized protein [Manis javanica]|uniref:uncharacterized protein n=1 Tax=Manis javanica TaxID=9974 RepID=UPI003C6D8143